MKSYMIIGAGILGASAAYHLAKAGADVTVFDRKHPGQATDAAAGIVCPWLSQRRNQAWYAIAKGGARYYNQLIQQLEADGETDTGYQKVGAVSLHTDEKKLSQMEERAYKRREDAPEIGDITRLTPAETKALFPALSEEYGAVHVKALLNAAVNHGAAVYNEEASILTEDGAVIGVKTAERTLTAGQVLVTAGAWARELLEPLGIRFSVSYQKAQIVHLELQGEDTGGWPVVMPPNDQYILAFDSGRIIAGATHENDTGMDLRVTAGGLREIFDKALTVAPGLSDSTVIETRVGFRPFTPGFLPVIGKVPNISGLLVANGLGASGLTSGPYLGAELAKLALGQQTEIDLSLYDPAGALE